MGFGRNFQSLRLKESGIGWAETGAASAEVAALHSAAGALMLVKIEVRFGRAAEYDVDVASHVRRVSNPLEFALLHHAFVLLALVLDAVLVLAVAAVWKLAHHLVWTIGGVAVRKTAAQPDRCPSRYR
jgi:hypothetical protein